MEHDIGYMQVHMRIYENGELYDSIAVNAQDECYIAQTDLVSSHHQVIDDPAKVYDKIFQVTLKVLETDTTIAMHVPIHQSEEWEVTKGTDTYTVGFYCILGKAGAEAVSNESA